MSQYPAIESPSLPVLPFLCGLVAIGIMHSKTIAKPLTLFWHYGPMSTIVDEASNVAAGKQL
jgi:hypothetical protein